MEYKPKTEIIEVNCDSALHKLKRKIPYSWDLNIYRGCQHGCKYCYAMYSHTYLNSDSFSDNIYVKKNIVEVLEKELRSGQWNREIVNIGGVTDSYQPVEADYKIMPEILRLFIKYKTPVIISTKSDLVLRDFDLINELSLITYVNIAATITVGDEDIRKLLEPGAVKSSERFNMLREFRKTNASVGLHAMPVIPYLTDSCENMEYLCENAHEAGVHYMLPGVLYLRGKTRKIFFDFINNQYPYLYEKLLNLYKTGGAGKEYKNEFYEMLNGLRNKYGLSGNYSSIMKQKMHRE